MPDAPRFWVYARDHILGPYEPEAARRLEAFCPDLPVCPEETLGGPDERWRRAADAEAFAADFPPEARTPEGAEPPKPGPWPPDPERAAVDVLSTAQERMGLIDRSLASTQERLERRREVYERLKRDLAARAAAAKELHDKMLGVGARLGGFLGMKQAFDQADAALAMQARRVAELEEQLRRVEEAAKAAPPPRAPEPPPEGEAPAPPPSTSKPRRRPKPASDALGLPPPTILDVPDFK
ncbi:MAG: hypothetical protein KGL53_13580 [Elusimicrobia bacterium]|nr:hypothetical protein [Elusimicrobiota bacterium]